VNIGGSTRRYVKPLKHRRLNPPVQLHPPLPLIKASRIAHLTDARYFAAKEVDYLGFNLEEDSEGYLDPMYMKAIREWVEGPKIVGEFLRAPIEVVQESASFFGLDAVQVSASGHGNHLADLGGVEVILQVSIGVNGLELPVETLKQYAALSDVLLFEVASGVDVQALFDSDPDYWRQLFQLKPSLLQADVTPSAWPALLQTCQLAGLGITGGEEEQTGVKSFDEIEEVFEMVDGLR
jgi:phosphoribosylanthranilate isomerase